jgi:hypothetical protein
MDQLGGALFYSREGSIGGIIFRTFSTDRNPQDDAQKIQ